MRGGQVPARVAWAVELLDVRPDAAVLEVGCGPGVAVRLLAERLVDGHVTAIDRSATALERAAARNADHVGSGRVVLRRLELAALEPDGPAFDAVLAVNVNLFWVRAADVELEVLRRRLDPAGALHLVYEAPDADRARHVERVVTDGLRAHGFSPSTRWADAPSLLGITATP